MFSCLKKKTGSKETSVLCPPSSIDLFCVLDKSYQVFASVCLSVTGTIPV